MTPRALTTLRAEDVAAFRRDGLVHLRRAFEPELALEIQGLVWAELREELGVEREQRSTWENLRKSPKRTKDLAISSTVATPRFSGAISDLVGREDWSRPKTWGGFLVNFPAGQPDEWDVAHDEFARPHAEHRKQMRAHDPWLAQLAGDAPSPKDRRAAFMEHATDVRGHECQVVELTGEPGDVVLCNLGLLHSPSRNCAAVPRVMRSKFLLLDPDLT